MSEQKVKRFVLMGGAVYYASGGFQDYINSYNSKEEADTAMEEWFKAQGGMQQYSWAHIGDIETGQIWQEGHAYNLMGGLF